MSTIVNHWIDNKEVPSTSGCTAPVYDPALGIESKRVALANSAEISAVIASAKKAFPGWANTSLARRQQIVFSFRELLNARKEELAAIITSEHGKVLSDALGEVTRGQEVVEFAVGIPHLMKGFYSENVSNGVDVYSTRQPLGVVGIISPFNFPAMVPMWFFPLAIAAGNTVVLKPSEKDPTSAMWLAKLWKEAGLPDGVFNVLHGDKEDPLVYLTQRDVRELQFAKASIATGWRLLMEQLNLKDEDIQQVLLAGSFGSYLSPASAIQIGLVPKIPVMRIVSAGNVAGEGAKMVLLSQPERNGATALLNEVEYVELSDRTDFNDKFVLQLGFPI